MCVNVCIIGACASVCGVCLCMGVCSYEFMCLVAYYSDTDPFGGIRTHYRRFEFGLIMSAIHW